MFRLTKSGFSPTDWPRLATGVGLVLAVTVALAACDDSKSSTELNPEGPPMVRQVFVQEKVDVNGSIRIKNGLAFGTHPDVIGCEDCDDDGVVNSAVARGNQQIRVVLDELVRGNAFEELACADGTWSQVPIGTDPDDIAKCSPPELSDCTAVCTGGGGAPIGILDENEDGAADDFRMIDYGSGELAVSLICDGTMMPLDQELSFYNPSGNQQIPAGPIGLNGLGPAVILVPQDGIRTGSGCTITFRDEVQDKDGNRVCAPADGDINAPCTQGDTSLISFSVEALELAGSDPRDGATNVPLRTGGNSFFNILLQFNAAIDPATTTGIALVDGAAATVPTTVTVSAADPTIVTVQVTNGLTANTTYTLTLPTSIADVFGGALPQEATISFTTGAGTPTPDAGIDGGVADAGAPDA